MKFQVSLTSSTPPNIRTVRKWGEPAMVDDSYSVTVRLVNGEPMGQFGLVQVYQRINGTYAIDSANQTAVSLTQAEMMNIALLQTADEYSIADKMNWLMNGGDGKWGSPLRATYNTSAEWYNATNIQQISAVYAGQPVEVLEERTFTNVVWQGKVEASVTMSRIKPGTLQKVTVVDGGDRYGEKPKGIIWLPLKFKGDEAWIFNRWLI